MSESPAGQNKQDGDTGEECQLGASRSSSAEAAGAGIRARGFRGLAAL